MHDIKQIRENPQAFDAALARRNLAPQSTELLKLDEQGRGAKTELQQLQARRNDVAKQIGQFIKSDPAKAEALKTEAAQIKEQLATLESGENPELTDQLMRIPNILAADVPEGKDESANKELRRVGEKPTVPNAKDHVALGEALGMMDFETAAKISGARFVITSGAIARLERALASFMLDIHTGEFGYTETNPPILVNKNALHGTGQLPKFEEDLFPTTLPLSDMKEGYAKALISGKKIALNEALAKYKNVPQEKILSGLEEIFDSHDKWAQKTYEDLYKNAMKLWLIPTAEVSLTNIVADSILEESYLPRRYTAHTPCFRSEAGSAGRDTRGMIRQHQFTKVELVSITKPEDSDDEHERMTACAEEILKRLGLHYRVMLLCAGDTGFGARKTYDIEVWLPGQDAFREISSCSNCGDFQARRMKARYRTAKGTEFVHTLNGSGLAVGRTLIAVLENYQQPDGSIKIPEALQPYMGGLKVIKE